MTYDANQQPHDEDDFDRRREPHKSKEKAIVAEILAEHDEPEARIAAWTLQTGKCKRTFYRRLKEIEES
ncbi:hypothetical protein [Gimesia chilikensis]|uniref:Helix-turn-helix domain-containing protein n=1 Tax=Gimesia chilikensis TaxID=2605989 RepID=A0A517PSZ9_9PLAN|nr:hypothetical protein [Gimesia chilikensis]QDT22496.1 hypothetical protein HG66A1_43040 [Gimesia chilikensis]